MLLGTRGIKWASVGMTRVSDTTIVACLSNIQPLLINDCGGIVRVSIRRVCEVVRYEVTDGKTMSRDISDIGKQTTVN